MDRHSARLFCTELPTTTQQRRDRSDRTLDRRRVLENLLNSEDRVLANPSYLEVVQCNQMTESMRRQLVEWMLEVCEEARAEDILHPLAVNLMDRVLSHEKIPKDFLQLTAAACLFLGSKVVQAVPLCSNHLCYMADHSFMPRQLTKMEVIVLDRLKWDLTVTTPMDFLNLIYGLLPVTEEQLHIIKKHASALVTLTCFEYRFVSYPPSVIAAAAACAAIQGMNMQLSNGQSPLVVLQEVIRADSEILQTCQSQIEDALSYQLAQVQAGPANAENDQKENLPQNDTPTEVLESVFQ